MRTIIAYKIISDGGGNFVELMLNVNAAITEGWQPLGAVCKAIATSQAMVKYAAAEDTASGQVTLTFNRYTEREELDSALNGWKYKAAFEEVWQKLFRPRHKHGYSNQVIERLLTPDQTLNTDCCNELMDELEKLYHECREDL